MKVCGSDNSTRKKRLSDLYYPPLTEADSAAFSLLVRVSLPLALQEVFSLITHLFLRAGSVVLKDNIILLRFASESNCSKATELFKTLLKSIFTVLYTDSEEKLEVKEGKEKIKKESRDEEEKDEKDEKEEEEEENEDDENEKVENKKKLGIKKDGEKKKKKMRVVEKK
jgi:hypothetical protein